MAVLRYFHQPPKATTSTVVVNNTAILTVSAALNNKVDKSAGRGLSQNNYSTPEKNKLEGVEEGAEVNVLADWNEQDTESDTYILNKPESLPASDVYEWAKLLTKPSYTPTEIGLGNVTNDAQVKRSEMGVANGVATLNQDGLVPSTQLPSYVDDVLEYSSASLFPRPGTDGKIYVDTATNLTYRWSGSDYVEISKSLALGETSSTAYRGDRGKTAYTHATDSSRLTTATSVGLYKVGCTAQGHISSLTAITKADITGLGIPAQDTNTTYSFAGGTNKFTVTPSGGTAQDVTVTPSISAATQSAAGLMSAADKKKLDGIAAGAQVNSVTGVKGNSESSYRTGNVNITATNIGLSNVANLDLSKAIKSITRSGTTFTYTCLDGTTGTFTQQDNNTTYSAGTGLSLSNTTFSLALTKKLVTDALGYTPPTTDTNTTYNAGSGLSLSGTTFSLALTKALVTTALGYTPPTSDTNTWRTVLCNGTSIGSNTLNLKAGTNVTLSNSNGTITISSTDTNTWRGIQNNLTSTSTSDSLSAYLGYLLANGSARDSTKIPLFRYGTTDTTTKIKININSTASWMLCFTVTLYQGYRATKIMISGYEYGSNHWYLPEARILGDSDGTETINVYFGYDATNKLWVGFDGGDYTGVSIDDVTNGYSQISDFSNLFTISNVSSLATLQTTVTAASKANYANSAGSATNDSDGNAINSTYLKKSGGTMTGSITMSQGASARNVGIVGTYDSTKSAAIWAMGASYQIPAAGNSLGSLYGAAYVYQGLAGQGTMAGGHQFVWAQNGSANAALGTNIWTSGKFIKNGGTSSLFLKADGSVDSNAYITGITKAMVTNALGYTPPTTDTNTWRTVLCNGTSIGNNTLNIKAGTNISLSNSNGTITISSTDTNTWRPLGTGASDACAGNDSRLSNSRPASDVYSWAKASTKPSYAWSEITSKPCSFYSGTCSKCVISENYNAFYMSMSLADAQKVYGIQFVPNTDYLYSAATLSLPAVTYNVNSSNLPANSWCVVTSSRYTTSCTYRYIKA